MQPIGIETCRMPDSADIAGLRAEIAGVGNTKLFDPHRSPGLMAADVTIVDDKSKHVSRLLGACHQ